MRTGGSSRKGSGPPRKIGQKQIFNIYERKLDQDLLKKAAARMTACSDLFYGHDTARHDVAGHDILGDPPDSLAGYFRLAVNATLREAGLSPGDMRLPDRWGVDIDALSELVEAGAFPAPCLLARPSRKPDQMCAGYLLFEDLSMISIKGLEAPEILLGEGHPAEGLAPPAGHPARDLSWALQLRSLRRSLGSRCAVSPDAPTGWLNGQLRLLWRRLHDPETPGCRYVSPMALDHGARFHAWTADTRSVSEARTGTMMHDQEALCRLMRLLLRLLMMRRGREAGLDLDDMPRLRLYGTYRHEANQSEDIPSGALLRAEPAEAGPGPDWEDEPWTSSLLDLVQDDLLDLVPAEALESWEISRKFASSTKSFELKGTWIFQVLDQRCLILTAPAGNPLREMSRHEALDLEHRFERLLGLGSFLTPEDLRSLSRE